jgi:hypothetical protein
MPDGATADKYPGQDGDLCNTAKGDHRVLIQYGDKYLKTSFHSREHYEDFTKGTDKLKSYMSRKLLPYLYLECTDRDDRRWMRRALKWARSYKDFVSEWGEYRITADLRSMAMMTRVGSKGGRRDMRELLDRSCRRRLTWMRTSFWPRGPEEVRGER